MRIIPLCVIFLILELSAHWITISGLDFSSKILNQLDSELELKRILTYVKPLMKILLFGQEEEARRLKIINKRGPSPSSAVLLMVPEQSYNNDRADRLDDYIALASGGGGGGGGGCYDDDYGGSDDLLLLLSLLAVTALLFWLISDSSTTCNLFTCNGRRKRHQIDSRLSATTWISMVDFLWNSNDEESCTLQALCNMNRIAIDYPSGNSGLAISLSSLPLSYLLHRQNRGQGLANLINASWMGYNRFNCTSLFPSCQHRQLTI